MSIYILHEDVIDDLKTVFPGKIHLRGDAEYYQAIRLWNAAVKTKPAAVVLCENNDDVQAAILTAKKYKIPLTVKGGGHDCSGLALSDGGLVIDLSKMRKVQIDICTNEAIIQGGTLASDLIEAADHYGLVAVTGAANSIGMASLIMGGGYGPLLPKYGLALDNLLSVTIVLSSGEVVTANENRYQDLFWAVRGGGGNFGVVVSMRVQLHTASPILFGEFWYPLHRAPEIFLTCDELTRTSKENLSVITSITRDNKGKTRVKVVAIYYGQPQEGKSIFAHLKNVIKPIQSGIRQINYKELLMKLTSFVTYNHCYTMKTRWLPNITKETATTILKGGADITSAFSSISIQYFYGAPTRIHPGATAFGVRKPHILLLITSVWKPEEQNNHKHKRWAERLSFNLAPHAIPGGYSNVLTAQDSDQVRGAYGNNLACLQAVKQKYDPFRMFRSNPLLS
jgi:hypothetical protein